MSHYAVHGPFDSDPRFAANYKSVDKNGKALAFATMIEGMDKSLGDLMDHLEAKGIAENTLVLFLGDNGSDAPLAKHNAIASSAPLRGRKGSRWEGGVRVPFIAAWAKPDPKNKWQKQLPIAADSVRQEICNCSDLFPTITQLIAAAVPDDHPVDGQNLAKLLAGQPDPDHLDVFLSHYPHRRGVGPGNDYFTLYRLGNWKVIYHYLDQQARYELYDLENDPSESSNLAADHPDKLKSMLTAMAEELEAKGAQHPERNGQPIRLMMP
jgi:arylsulfatase A-like enzyme